MDSNGTNKPTSGNTPNRPNSTPNRGGTAPSRPAATPPRTGAAPSRPSPPPNRGGTTPPRTGATPPRTGGTPPPRGGTTPSRPSPPPHRGGTTPPRTGGTPPPRGGTTPSRPSPPPHRGGTTPPRAGGTPPPRGGTTASRNSASVGRPNMGEPPEKTPKRRKKRKRNVILATISFIFKAIFTLILVGLTTGALLACFGVVYIKTVILPETGLDMSTILVNENSVMYYQNDYGEWEQMVTLLTTNNSIWKDYQDIPYEMIIATVAIEDKRFWEHPGVDWRRTGAAVLKMFTGQDIQGGSTITQQLIKNATQYDDVTVKRKIIEIFTALELDANYSKEDIITYYLNIIYLGEGCYGVGSAAWEYFGKDISQLSLAECASLISITNNPSIYSPYSTMITTDSETGIQMDGRARNKYRQELVLDQLYDQELITAAQYAASKSEELVFVRSADTAQDDVIYSWYEEQVISDVRSDLMEQYGYSAEVANRMLSSGGLSIYTLVDMEVQNHVESLYEDWSNFPNTSANGQRLQSAITVIDNNTGDIVAIVGQMGEKEQNLLQNFATNSYRQPGSSIKPLSVYAPALDMGLISPVSALDDYAYSLEGGSPWPSNAYGYYKGMVGLDFALQQSSNATATHVVGNLLTPEVSFDFMTNVFHIGLVDAMESYGYYFTDRAVAPLALGGLTQGVNTREMAAAYATFPNDGVYTHARTYSMVMNRDGEVILDNSTQREVAMKTTTAYYINELLQGVMSSTGTGYAGQISGVTVAGKTGTTNDDFDKYFVGYTPYYTAAVWTGYEYNEKIVYNGFSPAIDMWKKVMEPLHQTLENRSFTVPEGLTAVSYCLDSGLLSGSYCSSDPRGSRIASMMIHPDDAPTEYCTAHVAGSSVTICTASATVDADGNVSAYRIASVNCPSTTKRTTTYLSLSRVAIAGAYASDSAYVYGGQGYGSVCTVHNGGGSTVTDELLEDLLDPDNPFGDLFPSTGEDDSSSSGNSNSGNSGTTAPELPDSSLIPGLPSTTPDTTTPTTPTTPTEPETTTPTTPVEPEATTPTTPVVPETPAPTPEPTPTPTIPESSMIPGVG